MKLYESLATHMGLDIGQPFTVKNGKLCPWIITHLGVFNRNNNMIPVDRVYDAYEKGLITAVPGYRRTPKVDDVVFLPDLWTEPGYAEVTVTDLLLETCPCFDFKLYAFTEEEAKDMVKRLRGIYG
jgi:hypothetical protein